MATETEPPNQPDPAVAKAPPAGESAQAVRPGDRLSPGPPLPQPPVGWREVAALVAMVVLSDLTIYRGHGTAGLAALFFATPVLLLLGSPKPRLRPSLLVITGMLWLLAGRMIWQEWAWSSGCGFALLVAVAMALAGLRPYVLDALAYALQVPAAAVVGAVHYGRSFEGRRVRHSPFGVLNVLLPVAAVAVFGVIFILANPDLADSVGRWLQQAARQIRIFLAHWPITFGEVLFWLAAAGVGIGLLRPLMRRSILDEPNDETRPEAVALEGESDARASETEKAGQAPATINRPEPSSGRAVVAESAGSAWFWPWLNTLAAVVVLFAVYLAFEFQTLWFREFPEGFYYAGYAHEGAAWLTVALALATLVLSLVFREPLLGDGRLPWLRRLAWLWSLENLVLAAAVYNRLAIYVDFNGMTRMRTVGLFGVSTVVAGFVLVVWKILHRRDFIWLLRRQLWALAIASYLFALTPVDTLVHTYNVRRVLAGDLAPSVQISVHPISSEGILVLHPLVHSDNEIIREGIRAMLAAEARRAEARVRQQYAHGWTAYQAADHVLLNRLREVRDDWDTYADDPAKTLAALERFDEYVYQWY